VNDGGWQPNEAKPGEMYTPEGRIKAAGAFARGLKNTDPRTKRYRRQMQRTGLLFVAVVVAAIVAISLVTALF
jgi:hypothetical protein